MFKKIISAFVLSLFPVAAMASSMTISNPGSTAGVAVSDKGHCVYASRIVLPGGVIIHKNKQGKAEWKQVCTLTPTGWGKFSAPVRMNAPSSAMYARYTVSLGGKLVYSGTYNLASAKFPEHFTVTVSRAGKVVGGGFSGVTLPDTPMSNSVVTQISYVSGAVSKDDSRTVKLRSATLTTGKTFILIAAKHNIVHFVGDISRLVSLKTRQVHGLTIQTPAVKEIQVNQTMALTPGQSMTIPMGGYLVKIARS